MNKETRKTKGARLLRVLVVFIFLFLGLAKLALTVQYGLEPYTLLIDQLGLPTVFSYYGVVAMLIEFYFVVGVWSGKAFSSSTAMAILLTGAGLTLSVMLLVYRQDSDCGCGLLGENEYGLLAQKLILLLMLVALLKVKNRLFITPTQSK